MKDIENLRELLGDLDKSTEERFKIVDTRINDANNKVCELDEFANKNKIFITDV